MQKTMPTNRLREFFFTAIFSLISITAWSQWEKVDGPFLSSPFISLSAENIVASGDNACIRSIDALYVSFNKAKSWSYAWGGLDTLWPGAFDFDDSIIVASNALGLFKSTNYGVTYQSINFSHPANLYASKIFVKGNTIIVGMEDPNNANYDVYMSTNGGNTWYTPSTLAGKRVKDFASSSNQIYVLATAGIYKTINNGLTWVNLGLPDNSTNKIACYEDVVYAADNRALGSIWKKDGVSGSWIKISGNLPSSGMRSISANANFFFALTSNGIFRTGNSGNNWVLLDSNLTCTTIQGMSISGNEIFLGCSQGSAYSRNNGVVFLSYQQTYCREIYDVAVSENHWIAATAEGVNTSLDSGATWSIAKEYSNCLYNADSIIYKGAQNWLRYSKDHGETWNGQYASSLPTKSEIVDVVAYKNRVFAAVANLGVFVTEDRGRIWTNYGITLPLSENYHLELFDTTLCLASDSGVFIASVYSDSWQDVSGTLPQNKITALGLYFNSIMVGTAYGGLYQSDDLGNSWNKRSTGIPDSLAEITSVSFLGENVLAAYRGLGVLASYDFGDSWSFANDGLKFKNVTSFATDGDMLIAGTNGSSVWTRKLKELPLALSVASFQVSDYEICKGDTTSITVKIVGGVKPYTYSWNVGFNTAAIKVAPTTSGNYRLTVTDSIGDTIQVAFSIVVKPTPDTPVIKQKGNNVYTEISATHYWYYEGELIYTGDSTFRPPHIGYYTVIAEIDGCYSQISDPYFFLLDEEFGVFPNPCLGYVIFNMNSKYLPMQIDFYSMRGELVLHIPEVNYPAAIADLTSLPDGVYMIHFTNSQGKTSTTRLVKIFY